MDPLTYRNVAVNDVELAGVGHERGRRAGARAVAARFPRVGVLVAIPDPGARGAGYEVWAPNLRGYGESSKPPKVSDYDIDHLLADVAGADRRVGSEAR